MFCVFKIRITITTPSANSLALLLCIELVYNILEFVFLLQYFGLRSDSQLEADIQRVQYQRQDGKPVHVEIGPQPNFEQMCRFAGVQVGGLKSS